MSDPKREAEGIALYIQSLEAQAAGKSAEAKRLLEASVRLGEPMAMHAAAFQEANVARAISLYAAAADAGFAASAWNLYLHFSDTGDREEAVRWLRRAAKLGDRDAVKMVRELG